MYKRLFIEYISVKTDDDFEVVYGFPVSELTYIARDVSFRNGGDMLYYMKDGEEYIFYANNNLSNCWDKRDRRKELHEHYYNKYIFKEKYGYSFDELKKVEGNIYLRVKTKSYYSVSEDGDYKEIDKKSDMYKRLFIEYFPIKTDEDFEEAYGFSVSDLTYVTFANLTRDGGNDLYYFMKDGEYVIYLKNRLSKKWSYYDKSDKSSKKSYDYYYDTYICNIDE